MSNELNDVWWRLSDSETLWQWRHKDQPSKAEKGFHEFLYQSIISVWSFFGHVHLWLADLLASIDGR